MASPTPGGSPSSAMRRWRSTGCWGWPRSIDRKSTRLNSSHGYMSYAVFCLNKQKSPTLYSPPTDNFVALFPHVLAVELAFRDRALRPAIATAIERGRVLQLVADCRVTVTRT